MAFGMLPIVRYTGYADLLPNKVSWVRSVETNSGTIVVPGFAASSTLYSCFY